MWNFFLYYEVFYFATIEVTRRDQTILCSRHWPHTIRHHYVISFQLPDRYPCRRRPRLIGCSRGRRESAVALLLVRHRISLNGATRPTWIPEVSGAPSNDVLYVFLLAGSLGSHCYPMDDLPSILARESFLSIQVAFILFAGNFSANLNYLAV